jgi:hypothetical protein
VSDQIPKKIQVVVCHGPHNYLLEEVGVPQRGESYEPAQRVVVTAPPERVYLFDNESEERLR